MDLDRVLGTPRDLQPPPACMLLRERGTGVFLGDTKGLAFAEFDLDTRPFIGE